MENTCKLLEPETLEVGVFELPGEPAIVINGLPDIPLVGDSAVPSEIISDAERPRNGGFGEWLEGREVRKLFDGRYYCGVVTQFDKESGWYRVEYEDGDSEDLEWHELEEVLVPLDVMIPLKTLALKIIGKNQKPVQRTGKNLYRAKKRGAKSLGSKGKNIETCDEETSQLKFSGSEELRGDCDIIPGITNRTM